MEFNEKLQELRKSRGLTQEELAEALFVSRTAISKWESGRGYPSIDSLKEISRYFSVSIDVLLSGDQLIMIAEKENKSNLNSVCDLLLGFVDLFSLLLIFLPLYQKPSNGYIYAVNLFGYVDNDAYIITTYWVLFVSLTIVGIVKILMAYFKFEKAKKAVDSLSIGLSVIAVLFLSMAKEPYAITVASKVFCFINKQRKGNKENYKYTDSSLTKRLKRRENSSSTVPLFC